MKERLLNVLWVPGEGDGLIGSRGGRGRGNKATCGESQRGIEGGPATREALRTPLQRGYQHARTARGRAYSKRKKREGWNVKEEMVP